MAQDGWESVEVDAEAALVSDYRFRGVSLSDGKPALQAGVEVSQAGWFVGAWASTLEDHGSPGAELDLYLGVRGETHGLDYSFSLYSYNFDDSPSYVEGRATLGRDAGWAVIELELSYAPPQAGATRANLYAGGRIDAPLGDHGLSLVARGGYEEADFGEKWDWEVGAAWRRGPILLAASIVGAGDVGPGPSTAPGLLLSLAHAW